MALEQLLADLTDAIKANTAALGGTAVAPPEKTASSSKTKATKASSSPTLSGTAPAANPAESPAPATTPTASTTVVAPEVQQKELADAVLALAKKDRDVVVKLLEEYKVQRFGQLNPKDYAEFAGKLKLAEAAVNAAHAAKASAPESLV